MPAVLMHAAPEADADLFHAVPAGIADPFLYVERDGRRAAVSWVAEATTFAALGIEMVDVATLGWRALQETLGDPAAVEAELCLRACRRLGVTDAVVPPRFPLFVAEHLRANGVALRVDGDVFAARRRVKTAAQLAGLRRAQAAADAAMALAARMIADLRPSEEIREAMQAACAERGCMLPDDVIVAHGAQAADGHESGHGAPVAGEPVIVDIWPRDRASRCWTDMTRTFVAGGGPPPEELQRYWSLAEASLRDVLAHVRAGVGGRELWERSCAPFEAAGIPTARTAPADAPQVEGYNHTLGHGVGLEIHERPNLGRLGDTLVAGDVIAVEPGCYRPGFGGCRIEDTVIVTDDGYEAVTAFPYGLGG